MPALSLRKWVYADKFSTAARRTNMGALPKNENERAWREHSETCSFDARSEGQPLRPSLIAALSFKRQGIALAA